MPETLPDLGLPICKEERSITEASEIREIRERERERTVTAQ